MTITTGSQATAADVLGIAGAGHIILLPPNYNSIGQGTWAIGLAMASNSAAPGNGDNLTWKADLQVGTYSIMLLYNRYTSVGILDITVGGVEWLSQDCYGATLTSVRAVDTGKTIAAGGIKDIVATIDGKNGSSSDYEMYIQGIGLWRTA